MKLSSATCLVALVLSQQVYASNNEVVPEVMDISEKNAFGKWQGKLSTASIATGPVIAVDFLYYQAQIDQLEYALNNKIQVNTSPTLAIKANIQCEGVDFEWKPGVRVALGYVFPEHDRWDLFLTWNYLHSKAHGSSKSDPTFNTGMLRPVWLPFLLGSLADKASADWTLNFNTLDLSLGRNFFLGKWMTIHPFGGLRAAWIDQDYRVKYHAAYQYSTSGTITTLTRNTGVKASNDFSSIGLRAGVDLDWLFARNWSLFSSASASLLYGKFNIEEKFNGALLLDLGGGPELFSEIISLNDRIHRIRPNLEGSMGLKWATFFNRDKFRVALSAAYNFIYWFNQNQLINEIVTINDSAINGASTQTETVVSPQNKAGDLTMQGLNVELRFDF